MSNRLATETSPYLLQHAGNPVDWYPWGPEAIERAKREGQPIFLSIGYSACHWCHVMEHESFESDTIARLMNDNFVCVKVDREERPDLDQIYMNAVQLMTGRGGWPMSVFLTPDLKPFYGGTYWPPQSRMGMPGFDQVLTAVADAWRNRRQQAVDQAETLVEHMRGAAAPAVASATLSLEFIERAVRVLERSFDPVHGGFGAAPKFPHPMDLRLLLNAWRRRHDENVLRLVTHTLDKMAAGGMYDQLGGGFHRYSVDERWLVPHFEKMLYDNALLVPTYVDAFRATGKAEYAQVAREICDYVLREMTDAGGGFFSTQDADSEGVEGKFFVWTPDEVAGVLGQSAAETFCRYFDVTPEGNFEHGQSILNRPKTLAQFAALVGRDETELAAELASDRVKLLAVRDQRVHPGLDDKVLVAWNGLMIEALCEAADALDETRYLAAAQRCASFLLANMRRDDGRLLHTWRKGVARLDAYLDDYASLTAALVRLYQSDFDEHWIDAVVELSELMLRLFEDPDAGGFFYTASDHEELLTRQKDYFDNAVPSGNSLAALALLRLGKLTGRGDVSIAAERTLKAASGVMEQASRAAGQMLLALDFYLGPTPEIVILGDATVGDTKLALTSLRHGFAPNKVLACRKAQHDVYRSSAFDPLFAGKQLSGPEPGVWVCENFTCKAPVFGKEALLQSGF
jgi:uncharacterized protein YyaL (SSP411 family)